jgi:hypothetical protein
VKRELALLIAIVLVGLGLRIGYAVDQPYSPPPDAVAYERIAESLRRDGSFDARRPGTRQEVQPSSAYAPGLPLFLAGLYELSGGPDLTFALIVLAVIGAGAVPLAHLLGRRLGGVAAGLVAAAIVAGYPALLEYQSLLLTEPLGATLLVGSLLGFLAAADAPSAYWRWLVSGGLFGLLALVRPEYLILSVLLPIAYILRVFLATTPADGPKTPPGVAQSARRPGWRAVRMGVVSVLATLAVLAPWAIRNQVVLHRTVPISTGGGKALYIGTYLEADGDGPKLRELLLDQRPALRRRFERGGPVAEPGRLILEKVLARVAAESYPDLETDAALDRLARENLGDEAAGEPVRLAGMFVDKAYETWTDSARATMERQPWRTLQWATIVLALIGLVALLVRRRRFEAVVCGIVLAYMTMVGAILIASPRRELVVLPLLAALAGAGATACVDSLARWRS